MAKKGKKRAGARLTVVDRSRTYRTMWDGRRWVDVVAGSITEAVEAARKAHYRNVCGLGADACNHEMRSIELLSTHDN